MIFLQCFYNALTKLIILPRMLSIANVILNCVGTLAIKKTNKNHKIIK